MSSTTEEKISEQQIDFLLFTAIWDEEQGTEILDFYPKSSILDIESLASSIFTTYNFFWNKPDDQYQKTKVTLPIMNLNRKAHVLLDLFYNPELNEDFQPYIIVLLVPDYIADEKRQQHRQGNCLQCIRSPV